VTVRPRGLTRMVEVALALVLAGLIGLGALWWGQRSLMYFPSGGTAPPAALVIAGAEDVELATRDGLRLGAYFAPGRGEPPRPAVLVANGNAGDRADRAPLAAALARSGYSVLLFDYRGYGGNPGSPTEDGLLDDARAAADHLQTRPDVDPARIAYFGESLGSGVVTALAIERSPSALILRSPFTSFADVGSHHYPWLPVAALIRDRYPIDAQIGGVRAPVLVIAGEADDIVPPRFSRAVHAKAAEPKRLVVFDGVGHNDPELLAGDRMIEAVTTFLAEASR
jgi:fermentation-respiration switch protein FrsA (DUF1100 family)